MKRGATEHPKMLMLASLLGIPRWGAVGLMESVWHFAARYAPQGDIGKYTDEMIAAGIGWTEGAERLIEALIASKWLDKSGQVRLYVHDWHEHSDEYADKYLMRHGLTYANGVGTRRSGPKRSKRPTRGGQVRTSPDLSRESESESESLPPTPQGGPSVGDEIHQVLVECPPLRALTYEQDLKARACFAALRDTIDWKKTAAAAVLQAELMTEPIRNPGMFWRRQIQRWVDGWDSGEKKETAPRPRYVPLSERGDEE